MRPTDRRLPEASLHSSNYSEENVPVAVVFYSVFKKLGQACLALDLCKGEMFRNMTSPP